MEEEPDAFANVEQGLTGNDRTQMLQYWQNVIDQIENIDITDSQKFKTSALPLARVKKVMKTDTAVQMISAEAPALFAKGCEVFITELTMRAWIHAQKCKRRTLQKVDIAAALQKSDLYDFLIDIVPRETAQKLQEESQSGHPTQRRSNKTREQTAENYDQNLQSEPAMAAATDQAAMAQQIPQQMGQTIPPQLNQQLSTMTQQMAQPVMQHTTPKPSLNSDPGLGQSMQQVINQSMGLPGQVDQTHLMQQALTQNPPLGSSISHQRAPEISEHSELREEQMRQMQQNQMYQRELHHQEQPNFDRQDDKTRLDYAYDMTF